MGLLQELLHSEGVWRMGREEELSPNRQKKFLSELYSSLRLHHPVFSAAQLRQAQEQCFGWLQVAFHGCVAAGGVGVKRVESGQLPTAVRLGQEGSAI